jgi:uncharacterized membrane protein
VRLTLLIHIVTGGLALVSGYIALYSAKGAALHRKSGMVFVYAMLTMCTGGVVIAAARSAAPAINIPSALLTAYLVITALITVRPPFPGRRWVDAGAMLFALAVGLTCLTFGFEAIANGGRRNGMPAFPFFLFAAIGLLASALDLRMIRAGELQGAARLTRHLWRMCYALFVAAGSFFLGQADTLPKALRIPPLLALPVLAVIVTLFYWLRRVRVRRTARATAMREAA